MPNQTIDIYEVHKLTCNCHRCTRQGYSLADERAADAADSEGFAMPGGVTADELAALIAENNI